MALFKPYKGTKSQLDKVSNHDGYAYLTTDDSKLHFDADNKRYTINADKADNLLKTDGTVLAADNIYSKNEVDTAIENKGSYVSYNATLGSAAWVSDTDVQTLTYNYTNASLKCGKDGTVAPIISLIDTSDTAKDFYSQITTAVATPGSGIVFTIEDTNLTEGNTININIMDFE